ncbi:MAG: C1 family peptidase [Bacteroidaceae bacterium]
MNKSIQLLLGAGLFVSLGYQSVFAQNKGGITPDMMNKIRTSYQETPSNRALGNAIRNVSIKSIAKNKDGHVNLDNFFSDEVKSKGITNQRSSGRCWLFSGLNVLRAKMIAKNNLNTFTFSQAYPFFYDQLEKSNLFLQGIIDTRDQSMDDKMVEWLFKHPLSDGGQFTGVSDLLSKYGVVPSEVMPETYSTDNTSTMARLISLKLKEYALELRQMAQDKKSMNAIEARKTAMLGVVYKMLVLNIGEPPTHFTYTLRDAEGKVISTEEYTPKSFFDKWIGEDLTEDYVMLMNDPTRDFGQLYEIDYDRHVYDGHNWTYVNLPIDQIKKMAIASIKDHSMMYFSCDVGKAFSREEGTLDLSNYNYGDLFGVEFGMDKRQRIATFSSGSSHAMTLMAVNLVDGKPNKWKVENSWGEGPNAGHLILSDEWFDAYMFRLVVNKKYITEETKSILKQKPIRLPAWDPMFADEK